MKTLILEENTLSQAADLLKQDQLVAFPTETVYGLGANIFSETAIQKIYQVKGRPQDNPLIAHVGNLSDCEKIIYNPPDLFYSLGEIFFPGPLTLVVHRHPSVPNIVSAGLETIAVRMPSHPLARALIHEFGHPLVAPSANISGKPSSTCIQHVLQDFEEKIAAVIDGGPCLFGMESTVIDLVSFDRPTILRLGALKKEAIEKALGQKIEIYAKGPKASPGMRYRHYAPDLPVYLFTLEEQLENQLAKQKKSLVLSTESHPFFFLPLESETLYANLRLAEAKGYDEVIIYCPRGVDETMQNRLEKIIYENHSH